MKCVYCNKNNTRSLSIAELFSFTPLCNKSLCEQCKSKFTSIKDEFICIGCSKSVENNETLCSDCRQWQLLYPTYEFHHEALFKYDEVMHEWFLRYKFIGDYQLAYSFAPEIYQKFRRKKEIIVPIPLSEKRLEERGFNQVSAILDMSHIKYEQVLIKNSQDAVPQSKKNKKERMNLQQPFGLNQDWKEKVDGKSFILVDDIYTTGRTLYHAADCLFENGAKKVSTFSLAR